MDSIEKDKQNKTVSEIKTGIFSGYFESLKMGNLLNQSGIKKSKGASPLSIFTIVFNMTFVGKNVYDGIVRNKNVTIGKDAVYAFLNSSTYNWRKFTLLLFDRIYIKIRSILDDSKEEVTMNEEMDNLTFIDALKRILQITMAFFVKSKGVSENIMQDIFDTIMGYAMKCLGLKNGQDPLLAG